MAGAALTTHGMASQRYALSSPRMHSGWCRGRDGGGAAPAGRCAALPAASPTHRTAKHGQVAGGSSAPASSACLANRVRRRQRWSTWRMCTRPRRDAQSIMRGLLEQVALGKIGGNGEDRTCTDAAVLTPSSAVHAGCSAAAYRPLTQHASARHMRMRQPRARPLPRCLEAAHSLTARHHGPTAVQHQPCVALQTSNMCPLQLRRQALT